MRWYLRGLLVAWISVMPFGCGDDNNGAYVGAPCRGDYDCAPGTYCVDSAGGTCFAYCRGDLDCPGGWHCKDKDRRGSDGKVAVCVPD